MDRLSQIQTFILVAEKKSLTAVARELNISPAAISKQLTRLESDLGSQLLNRSSRNVELTEVGLGYYEQCKRILEEIAIADALIAQVKSVPHGTLKVVSGRHFASMYIVPHLREFLTLYPSIQLNLELAERIPDIEVEMIDILIGMSIPAAGGQVIQRRIATTRYALCASPEYLQRFGEPEKPNDLIQHRYIAHSMRRPDCELIFRNKEIIRLKPYLYLNDTETMARLAEDGVGIAKLHYYVVSQALQQGKLQEILSTFLEEEVPIYVAFPQRRYTPTKVRCFIDFITNKTAKNLR